MSRALIVVVAGALFGAIGLGSAYGLSSLRIAGQRPDLERLAMVFLPALWAAAGVAVSVAMSAGDRRS